MNNSLAALGLSTADIQKVDQVAKLVNDFNPVAYGSLIFQLEAVANSASRAVASNNATAGIPPAAGTQPSATARNANNTGGALTSNSDNLTLQGVQVQLTFTNGQTAQVLAAVANTNPPATRVKAATP